MPKPPMGLTSRRWTLAEQPVLIHIPARDMSWELHGAAVAGTAPGLCHTRLPERGGKPGSRPSVPACRLPPSSCRSFLKSSLHLSPERCAVREDSQDLLGKPGVLVFSFEACWLHSWPQGTYRSVAHSGRVLAAIKETVKITSIQLLWPSIASAPLHELGYQTYFLNIQTQI